MLELWEGSRLQSASTRRTYPPRTLSTRRDLTWLHRLLGIAVATGLLAFIGWCAFGRQSGDGYSADAATIINDSTAKLDAILPTNDPEVTVCEGGLLTACDRAVGKLEKGADELGRARSKLITLNPPQNAASWHRDYLKLLSDAESAIR